MTDEKGYNGWKNYETWNMALWIDNDQGSYSYSRELAQTAYDDAQDDDETSEEIKRTAAGELADALMNWQTEEMPDVDASCWSDLLQTAFGRIDWYEIAENYLEDVETVDA